MYTYVLKIFCSNVLFLNVFITRLKLLKVENVSGNPLKLQVKCKKSTEYDESLVLGAEKVLLTPFFKQRFSTFFGPTLN